MLTDPELSFKLLFRIYYGLVGKTPEFDSIWRSVMDVLFREIGKRNRTYLSNLQVRRPIRNHEDFNYELLRLPEQTATDVLAILKIISEISSREFEVSMAGKISELVSRYRGAEKNRSFHENLESRYQNIKTEYLDRQKSRPVRIRHTGCTVDGYRI